MISEINQFQAHEFIGVSANELRKLRFSKLRELTTKLVVLQPVTFRNKRDFNAHRLLRAIDKNTLLSKLPPEEQAAADEQMYTLKSLQDKFEDFGFIFKNTQDLLDQCSIHFDFSAERKPQNQQIFKGSREEDEKLLEELCQKA